MNDLIERVARAICEAEKMNPDDRLGGWVHWRGAAKAAIAAGAATADQIVTENLAVGSAYAIAALVAERDALRKAIAWACGEEPDPDGNWFGANINQGARPYWWRTNLRALADRAALSPEHQRESSR